MTSLALMMSTTLCYSATSDAYVADYGTLCRVDMGNVGVDAYYVFTYSVTNEAGEELLGVSGITIDLSDCEFTLMASK